MKRLIVFMVIAVSASWAQTTHVLVDTDSAQTLSNKTLQSPVVTGNMEASSVNGVFGTSTATGTDLGAKVAWVYANLCPSTGCVIDARDASGTQAWSSTLSVSGKPLTLILGQSTITSTVKPAISVSGTWSQKSFFNLYGQGNSTLFNLSSSATGTGTGLVALGDGTAYNDGWGTVGNIQFDCGGFHCIDVNEYTNGMFVNLFFSNYNDRALKLLHAWDTVIIGGNFNAGATGAYAALTLNDASNTVVTGSSFYASRSSGVTGVEFEGTPSNNVRFQNIDCGDDYVCIEIPKLSSGAVMNTYINAFFENQASPLYIGRNGSGSIPMNVTIDGGQVSASPASGSFQIDAATNVIVRGMNLQYATYGVGVIGLILENNIYSGAKTNNATSYVDMDDPANVKYSGTVLAKGEIFTPASSSSRAGINLPHGVAPTSPVNGDCWTTTLGLYCYINGVTVGPYSSVSGTDQWITTSAGLTSTGDQNVACATFSFSPSQPDTNYKAICSCNTTANNRDNHFAGIVGIKNKATSSIDICLGASGSSGGTCTNFDCHLHHN